MASDVIAWGSMLCTRSDFSSKHSVDNLMGRRAGSLGGQASVLLVAHRVISLR
jgi:hypothetical protein